MKKNILICWIMFILLCATISLGATDEIFIHGIVRNATTNNLSTMVADIFLNITNTTSGKLVYSQTQSNQLIDNGVYHTVFDAIDHGWFLYPVSFTLKIDNDVFTQKTMVPVPVSHAAYVANDSKYLGGQSPSYYLDDTDTTIGNCSVADSCNNIIYSTNTSWITDNQDQTGSGNCSEEFSCSLVIYDGSTDWVEDQFPSCELYEKIRKTEGFSCVSDLYNTTEEMQDAVLSGGENGVGTTFSYDDVNNNFSIDFVCGDIADNGITCLAEPTRIAVTNYGGIIFYTNITWITDNQDFIGNCSADQSCDNIIYVSDKLGNTTNEIRNSVNGSGIFYNVSIPCSLITQDGGGGDTDFCDDQAGGGSGASKWIDSGSFIEPNTTYATNVIVRGYIYAHEWSNVSKYLINVEGWQNLSYSNIVGSIGNHSADVDNIRSSITNNITDHENTYKHGNTTDEIRAQFSAGTNITITSGVIAVTTSSLKTYFDTKYMGYYGADNFSDDYGNSGYKKDNLTIDYPNLDTDSSDDLSLATLDNSTILRKNQDIILSNPVHWVNHTGVSILNFKSYHYAFYPWSVSGGIENMAMLYMTRNSGNVPLVEFENASVCIGKDGCTADGIAGNLEVENDLTVDNNLEVTNNATIAGALFYNNGSHLIIT